MHSSTLHKRSTLELYFIVIFSTLLAACASGYSCLVKYNFLFPPETTLFVVPYLPPLYLSIKSSVASSADAFDDEYASHTAYNVYPFVSAAAPAAAPAASC